MPPRSKFARPAANRVFTNRERPIALFNQARENLAPDQHRILIFYGIGGQGKTALCRKLREILDGESPRRALVERFRTHYPLTAFADSPNSRLSSRVLTGVTACTS